MSSRTASAKAGDSAVKLIRRVKGKIRRVLSEASRIPVGRVRWGDLRNLEPICTQFGFSRGTPVDRYYIEAFLAGHAKDISGRVLEIKDPGYTKRFGGARVTHGDVLDIRPENPDATIVADLNEPKSLKSETYDCIVFTQTLQLFFNPAKVLRHLHRSLKPGGVLLMTVPGITPVRSRDTWYWSFTDLAVRSLLDELFAPSEIFTQAYGNVVSATAFLQGLCASELRDRELASFDPAFPMLIGARAVKTR